MFGCTRVCFDLKDDLKKATADWYVLFLLLTQVSIQVVETNYGNSFQKRSEQG